MFFIKWIVAFMTIGSDSCICVWSRISIQGLLACLFQSYSKKAICQQPATLRCYIDAGYILAYNFWETCPRSSMDRAPDFESVGCRFDSGRGRLRRPISNTAVPPWKSFCKWFTFNSVTNLQNSLAKYCERVRDEFFNFTKPYSNFNSSSRRQSHHSCGYSI
jgi:hypothetical protein